MLTERIPKKRSTRRAILDEHGLLHAPSAIQAEFWRRHNLKRGLARRPVARLDELTTGVVGARLARTAERLQRVVDAWDRVLPAAFHSRTRVESLDAGVLRVTVDCAPLKFVLSRQIGAELLSGMNVELSGKRITRIQYRVGPAAR